MRGKLGLKSNTLKSQNSPLPGHRDHREAATPTLDRNQPADPPLLLWPTLIFISCPRSGASSVNLSSAPFSKLFFSLSSLRSPERTDTQENYREDRRRRKNQLPTEGWSQNSTGEKVVWSGGRWYVCILYFYSISLGI